MRRTLLFFVLPLVLVGCGKDKPTDADAPAGPNDPTPIGPNPVRQVKGTDAAYDAKMNSLGLFLTIPHDLLDRDGTVVYSLPSGEGADALLGKIPDPGVPFGLELTVTANSPNKLTAAGLKQFKVVSNLRYLNLHQQGIGDDGAAALARFPNLQELDLGINDLTDDGVAKLKGLTKLRRLVLSGNGITDDGLAHLTGLTNLTHLEIGPSRVTDDGLKHLAGLTNLTVLRLSGSQITDAGLDQLAKFTKLSRLDIDANERVTDAGLAKLTGLKKLTESNVNSTGVTDAGEQAIKAALPDCEVRR